MPTVQRFSSYVALVLPILFMSSFAAAQDRGPTETAKQLFAAVEKKDAEAFKGLTCKSVRDYVETSARKDELSQLFMGIVEMGKPDKSASASEKIEGDKATVTFTKKSADGSSESSSIELTKDGDRWTAFCLDAKTLEGFQLSDKITSRLAGAKAIDDPEMRKQIEDFYAKRDQAFKSKDIDSYKSMEADDYKTLVWLFVPNISTRQEADQNAAGLMQAYKVVDAISTKVDSIKQGADENEVLVETSYTMRWTDQGSTKNLLNAKYREALARTKDGWKIRYSEAVEFSQKAQ